jgi:hypothetical protein
LKKLLGTNAGLVAQSVNAQASMRHNFYRFARGRIFDRPQRRFLNIRFDGHWEEKLASCIADNGLESASQRQLVEADGPVTTSG